MIPVRRKVGERRRLDESVRNINLVEEADGREVVGVEVDEVFDQSEGDGRAGVHDPQAGRVPTAGDAAGAFAAECLGRIAPVGEAIYAHYE
jgi:hypothetical protein